jgi:sRNA-binding carbon storage regulator CsrA
MGLVLSRRVKQRIYIKRGDRVIAEVEVSKIRGNTVFLYIDADEDLYITRDKDWSEKRLDKEVPVSRLHD